MYVPFAQNPSRRVYLVVLASNPTALIPVLRRELRSLDPDQALSAVRSMESVIEEAIWAWRFFAQLFWTFAIIAVILAAVGVYGVISYSVARRAPEVGIRMALGAKGPDVAMMILRQATRIIAAGLAVGLLAAVGLSRVMKGILYEVDALDLPTFIAVTLFLAITAVLAAYLPARRAGRVDPVTALRRE